MKRLGFTLALLSGFVFAQACSNIESTPTKETTVVAVAKTSKSVPSKTDVTVVDDVPEPEIKETTVSIDLSQKSTTPSPASVSIEPVAEPTPPIKKEVSAEVPSAPSEVVEEDVVEEVQPATLPSPVIDDVETVSGAPSHAVFSGLLKENVSRGKVNYAGFKKDQAILQGYIEMLGTNAPADSWSRNEKLAYWINAYNAVTINLILDNYPLTSITDLNGGKPWDKKAVTLGGKSYSLNEIENDIIRPKFNEPRIHFAVNCAAISCPPIRNEAFVASKLEEQLDEQTRSFLKNEAFNSLNGNSFRASKIFDWYGEDFGDLKAFIAQYTNIPSDATIEFVDYNWALNKQ